MEISTHTRAHTIEGFRNVSVFPCSVPSMMKPLQQSQEKQCYCFPFKVQCHQKLGYIICNSVTLRLSSWEAYHWVATPTFPCALILASRRRLDSGTLNPEAEIIQDKYLTGWLQDQQAKVKGTQEMTSHTPHPRVIFSRITVQMRKYKQMWK